MNFNKLKLGERRWSPYVRPHPKNWTAKMC